MEAKFATDLKNHKFLISISVHNSWALLMLLMMTALD